MMQTMFKCSFLLLVIVRTEASREFWKFRNSSANERTMKSILESCYKDEIPGTSSVVISDYNIFDDKSLIIRLGHSFEVKKHVNSSRYFKVSKIIIFGETSKELVGSLKQLSNTQWWKSTVMIFMIDENKECENMDAITLVSESMELLNLIYVCSKSNDTSVMATVNWISNYAPHPWKRLENHERNTFTRIFDPNVPCGNLFFDKTKILNGHKMRMILRPMEQNESSIGYLDTLRRSPERDITLHLILTIINNLKVDEALEFVETVPHALQFLENKRADIFLNPVMFNVTRWQNFIFHPQRFVVVAVVRLNSEVSTLEKIYHIWSTQVLYAAAIALLIFLLVLTIINKNFTSAALDLTRLLVYSSILRVIRKSSFRIYFITILILMVISNGVFHGQIAAFLTKTEKSKPIETIDELLQLDYWIYAHFGTARAIEIYCPKCPVHEVSVAECTQYVIKYPRHVCFTEERIYEQEWILEDLDLVGEKLVLGVTTWFHRKNWPLADSFMRIITRLTETGIIQFWKYQVTEVQKQKRKAMESEWHSAQYRPVKLYKLDFAFHLLAIGLGSSIIIFLLEVLVARAGGWWSRCLRVLKKWRGVKGLK